MAGEVVATERIGIGPATSAVEAEARARTEASIATVS